MAASRYGTFAGLIAVLLSMMALGREPTPNLPNLLLAGGAVLALVLSQAAMRRKP